MIHKLECLLLSAVGLVLLPSGMGALASEDAADEFADVQAAPSADELAAGDASTLGSAKSKFGLNGDISETGSYVVEMLLGVLVVVYVLVHVAGRAANKRVIDNWLAHYDALFGSQFAATGAPDTALSPVHAGERTFQESASEYTYYATGRENISSMHVKFSLRHRHDLLMWFIDTVLFPVEDKVTVEIVFPEDRKCDPALFAVLNKTRVVPFRDEHSSLKEIMVATPHPALCGSLVLLAENSEGAKELLPDAVLEALAAHENCFESLFVTDQNGAAPLGYSEPRRFVATCTLKLPSDSKSVSPVFDALLALCDHLATVKLSMAAKNRVDKNRRLIKEQLDKLELEKAKEALEQKKQDKQEKEKLMYDTLTPQEKARRDEKEEKKRKKDEEKKKFKKK